MYVDPSRVQMLARYAARVAEGSPEELAGLEGEVRLFIEAAWAEASAEARARFMDAVRRVGPPMPWAAVTVPHFVEAPAATGPQGRPTLRGPAALELLVGQADPEDEGVPGYRVDVQSAAGRRAFEALMSWEARTIEAIAAPAGWRLEAIEGAAGVADRGDSSLDEDVATDESPASETPTSETAASETPAKPSWWGLAFGGAGFLGAVGLALWSRKTLEEG